MYSITKKEVSKGEIFYLLSTLAMSLGFQVFIINSFPQYTILLILFFMLLLISVIMYIDFLQDFSTFLLIVNFFPLFLLNNDFHYDFNLELLSFIPLFILILFAIFTYLLTEKKFSLRMGYLELPIILIVLYFGISAFIGMSYGRNGAWILHEFFHFCLYLTIIPVAYLINKREKYFMILKFLLFISIMISIEYLIYDLFFVNGRFVTFQSGFMPLTVGVMFTYFLYTKGIIKKLWQLLSWES